MTPKKQRARERAQERETPKPPEEQEQTPEAAKAGESPRTAPQQEALQDRLAAKEQECQELLERLQRTTADYLNYQKRVRQRVEEATWGAVRDLVVDLLPVIDNFERALAAAETEPDFDAFHKGVRLVHDQLLAALEAHGVSRISAAGQEFDPEHHEAVAHLPSDQHPANRVIEVMQTGYGLRGRTVRASRVAVSSGKPRAEPGGQEPEAEAADTPDADGGDETSTQARGETDADV